MTKRKYTDSDDPVQKEREIKKKKPKKPKIRKKVEREEEDENEGSSNLSDVPKDRFPNQIPVKKTKKRKRKGAPKIPPKTAEPNPDQRVKAALKYLKTWYKHRDEWKFQKVRQMCLLQHMYDRTKISDKKFKRLLGYLEGLSGASKEKTIKEAGQVLVENDSEIDEEDKSDSEMADTSNSEKSEKQVKKERATQILQLLS